MILDIVSCVLLMFSAFLSIFAALGLLRFPDFLSRLHAGSKPQVLGLILAMIAIAIQAPTFGILTTLLLIVLFQMATTPVGTHMVGRAGYRTKHLRRSMLYQDQLAEAVAKADARDVTQRVPKSRDRRTEEAKGER
ncbi:monovalent cation/H(+) antiporter subunit G [Brevibacterium sp. UMB1308A]|uniref:monovalent cation/H(+) antiporter subunit G n=1 Tax=Brevibacterium sp. UMB1308A TaxID=3050608 RepID=UPI00254E6CF2|nr:monovalent cation/H(+) antiporter subunit G [Brevibacterium sp. UMB1308A]MDK8346026.1 monovalent cation/H(+) antiporter subunit G [Brevibacterium sp. UMB1308B]MDK8713029.1 monovalent cation/H(+) antiporter subunit G [Brevibacterium sp. UMB1308A]